MTSSTPEGLTVPASVIPAAAWGLSGRALSPEEIAAADPFGGHGIRLDIPAGRDVTIADIQQATGLEHVVLFSCGIAWAEREPGFGEGFIWFRWQSWLAREEVTDST